MTEVKTTRHVKETSSSSAVRLQRGRGGRAGRGRASLPKENR